MKANEQFSLGNNSQEKGKTFKYSFYLLPNENSIQEKVNY
jgi:hypothetical protein